MSSHNKKATTGLLWYWSSATFVVLCLYTALGYGMLCFYPWRPVAMGAPEAIMLEFAEIPTAPDVEEVSETIQQAQAEDKQAEPVEEPETLPEEKQAVTETPPSDMQEEVRREKKKTEQPKPDVDRPRKKKPHRQRRDDVRQAGPAQRQSGPQITARKGAAYKGPATSRNDGDYGRQIASWQRRVARKIQDSASRFDYSGSGRVVYITFQFDRQGRINNADVTRSSGNDSADSLALRAVKRATPIPAPPEGHKLVLTVPVRLDQGGF